MTAFAWFMLGINAALSIARLRAGQFPMFNLLAVVVLALALAGCAGQPADPCSVQPGASHNSCGGYVPACGNLPPLVGDDC